LRVVPAHARRCVDVMGKMRIALGCVAMTAPVKITAAVPVIVAPSTEAAVTNCAWMTRSCNSYCSVAEAQQPYAFSPRDADRLTSKICDAVSPDRGRPVSSSTQAQRYEHLAASVTWGDCKQLTIFGRDRKKSMSVAAEVDCSNACVEFYRPVMLENPGWIVRKPRSTRARSCAGSTDDVSAP
jgi:hypothetical protein